MRMSELAGKTIISDETGRNFGKVGDISFICDTGELMNVIVKEPTQMAKEKQLQQEAQSKHLFLKATSLSKTISLFLLIASLGLTVRIIVLFTYFHKLLTKILLRNLICLTSHSKSTRTSKMNLSMRSTSKHFTYTINLFNVNHIRRSRSRSLG